MGISQAHYGRRRAFRVLAPLLALLGIAFAASACERLSKRGANGSGDPSSRAALLEPGAGAGAGNGEGYLGLVSSYQVLPGHECGSAAGARLAFAASLVRLEDGRYLLSGDACSNQSQIVDSGEVQPMGGGVLSARGALFETLAAAPDPADGRPIYAQIVCSWKDGPYQYTSRLRSNMAGDDLRLELHRLGVDPLTGAGGPLWIAKGVSALDDSTSSLRAYRDVTGDFVLEVDLEKVLDAQRNKFSGRVRYRGGGFDIDAATAECRVNLEIKR